MFKNTAAVLSSWGSGTATPQKESTSAHSRSVASFYSESAHTRSEYDDDYEGENEAEEDSVYSDDSSLTEDNIYLTSASVSSGTTMDDIGRSTSSRPFSSSALMKKSGHSKSKISLGPAMSCDRMMSSHKIQNEKGSRRSLFGDQFEETTAASSKQSKKSSILNMKTKLSMEDSDATSRRSSTSSMKHESRNSSPSSGKTRAVKPSSSLKVTLNDFDLDHLKIQNERCDDEDSCEEGEAWMVKKLEKNSPELYWLQLSTGIEDPVRLIQAMRDNRAVRNVTVYSCALESLAEDTKKDLVDAICQLPNLKTLIVFQDCGSLFLDPLIRYGPNLTRLTLYKLNFAAGSSILHKLIMLVAGLPTLEELSLEKYQVADSAKLLRAVSGLVLNTTSLKTLTMTPARNVKVSSDGLLALINAFGKNNSVKNLALHGSESGMNLKCVQALASILEENNTALGEIKLTGFWRSEEDFWKRFPEELTDQIQFYLNLNKSGVRTMQLDVNASLGTLQNAMVTNRENVDVLFFLLLNNPILVEIIA